MTNSWAEILLQNGVLGVVLAWFMFRLEKILSRNTDVLNRALDALRDVRKAYERSLK